MISWDICKEDFSWEGSLRDIYVAPVTINDWQTIYQLLNTNPEMEYSVNGIHRTPPTSVDQVFAVRPSGDPMIRIRVERILVVFHFFSDKEIECDIDPRDVTSQEDLDALLGFMSQIGDALNKPVVITPENLPDHPLIAYDPQRKEFEHAGR